MNGAERDGETEMRRHERGSGSAKRQLGHNEEFPYGATLSYLVFVRSPHSTSCVVSLFPCSRTVHVSGDVLSFS